MKLVHLETPRYSHRCTHCAGCVWLGRTTFYDLYACRRPSTAGGVVLVARFGDKQFDLATFALAFYLGRPEDLVHPFNIAYAKAIQAGCL